MINAHESLPLICERCGLRIWRASDKGQYVDQFIYDRHLKCEASVEWKKKTLDHFGGKQNG